MNKTPYYVLGNFFDAFAKLRETNIRFLNLIVRPSAWNSSARNGTEFQEISYLIIFQNSVEKPPNFIKIGQE